MANAAAEDGWDASQAEGWAEAVADTCARTGWTKDVVCPGKPLKQRAVSEAIDKGMFRELCESSSLFDRARLLSQSGVGAGAWLGVIPSGELGYVFDSREFTTLLGSGWARRCTTRRGPARAVVWPWTSLATTPSRAPTSVA